MANINVRTTIDKNLQSALAGLSANLRSVVVLTQQINNSAASTSNSLRQLNAVLNSGTSYANTYARSTAKVSQNQLILASYFHKTAQAAKDLERQLKSTNSQSFTPQQKASAQRALTQMQQQVSMQKQIQKTVKNNVLREESKNLTDLSNKTAQSARRIVTAVTLPIAMFYRTAFTNYRRLETETVRTTKLLGDSYANAGEAIKELGKELDQVTFKYGIARELAQSLASDYAELGITSIKTLGDLTELTAAIEKLGNVDIGQSQEFLKAVYQNVLRLKRDRGELVKTEKDYADVIAEVRGQLAMFNLVENKTSLSLKDIAKGFPELTASATSFGLSMTEATALLIPMVSSGFQLGASANSVKVSLQRLVAMTKQNSTMIKTLKDNYAGFNLEAGVGIKNIQNLTDSYSAMEDKAGSAETLKFFSQLFGVRQGPRMEVAIKNLAHFQDQITSGLEAIKRGDATSRTIEGDLVKRLEDAVRRRAPGLADKYSNMQIKKYEDLSKVVRLSQSGDKQVAQTFTLARQDLAKYLKDEAVKGNDKISQIQTESGRALMIAVAGGGPDSEAARKFQQEIELSLQTSEVKYQQVRESIKSIGRALVPILADIFKYLAPIVQKVAEFVTKLPKGFKAIISLGAILIAAIGPLMMLKSALYQLRSSFLIFKTVGNPFSKMREGALEVESSLLAASDVFFKFKTNIKQVGDKFYFQGTKKELEDLKKLALSISKDKIDINGQPIESRRTAALKRRLKIKNTADYSGLYEEQARIFGGPLSGVTASNMQSMTSNISTLVNNPQSIGAMIAQGFISLLGGKINIAMLTPGIPVSVKTSAGVAVNLKRVGGKKGSTGPDDPNDPNGGASPIILGPNQPKSPSGGGAIPTIAFNNILDYAQFEIVKETNASIYDSVQNLLKQIRTHLSGGTVEIAGKVQTGPELLLMLKTFNKQMIDEFGVNIFHLMDKMGINVKYLITKLSQDTTAIPKQVTSSISNLTTTASDAADEAIATVVKQKTDKTVSEMEKIPGTLFRVPGKNLINIRNDVQRHSSTFEQLLENAQNVGSITVEEAIQQLKLTPATGRGLKNAVVFTKQNFLELAKLLGIKLPTVFDLMDEFINDKGEELKIERASLQNIIDAMTKVVSVPAESLIDLPKGPDGKKIKMPNQNVLQMELRANRRLMEGPTRLENFGLPGVTKKAEESIVKAFDIMIDKVMRTASSILGKERAQKLIKQAAEPEEDYRSEEQKLRDQEKETRAKEARARRKKEEGTPYGSWKLPPAFNPPVKSASKYISRKLTMQVTQGDINQVNGVIDRYEELARLLPALESTLKKSGKDQKGRIDRIKKIFEELGITLDESFGSDIESTLNDIKGFKQVVKTRLKEQIERKTILLERFKPSLGFKGFRQPQVITLPEDHQFAMEKTEPSKISAAQKRINNLNEELNKLLRVSDAIKGLQQNLPDLNGKLRSLIKEHFGIDKIPNDLFDLFETIKKEIEVKREEIKQATTKTKKSGGGGVINSLLDPFESMMPGRRVGPRMPQIGPNLMQMTKGDIPGGVQSVIQKIAEQLQIPSDVLTGLIQELKTRAPKLAEIVLQPTTQFKGDLDRIIKEIGGFMQGVDMSVEGVYSAIIQARNTIYKSPKTKTASKKQKATLLGGLKGLEGQDAIEYINKNITIEAIKAMKNADDQVKNSTLKHLQYLGRRLGLKKADVKTKALAEQSVLKAIDDVKNGVIDVLHVATSTSKKGTGKIVDVATTAETVIPPAISDVADSADDVINQTKKTFVLTDDIIQKHLQRSAQKRQQILAQAQSAATSATGSTTQRPSIPMAPAQSATIITGAQLIAQYQKTVQAQQQAVASGNKYIKFLKNTGFGTLNAVKAIWNFNMALQGLVLSFIPFGTTSLKITKGIIKITSTLIGLAIGSKKAKRDFDDFKKSLKSISTKAIDSLITKFSSLKSKVSGGFNNMFSSATSGVVNQLSYQLGPMGMMFGNMIDGLTRGLSAIPVVGKPAVIIIGLLTAGIVGLKKTSDIWGKQSKVSMENLKQGFNKLKDTLKALIAPFEDFIATLFGIGSSTGLSTAKASNKLDGLAKTFNKIAGFIKQLVETKIAPAIRFILTVVMYVINAFKPFLSALFNALGAQITAWSAKFKGNIDSTSKKWGKFRREAEDAARESARANNAAAENSSKAWAKFRSAFVKLTKDLFDLWKNVIVTIQLILTKWATVAVVRVAEVIYEIFITIFEKIADAFNEIMSSQLKGIPLIGKYLSKGIDWLSGLRSSAAKYLKGLGKDWADEIIKSANEGTDALLKVANGKTRDSFYKMLNNLIKPGSGKGLANKVAKILGSIFKDPSVSKQIGDSVNDAVSNAINNLQSDFYNKLVGNLASALSDIKNEYTTMLNAQKDAALKIYDDQIAAIDELAAAEERLTATQEYEEERRKRIRDRAFENETYLRDRELALYQGRIEDVRRLDRQETVNKENFQADLASFDKDRQRTLQTQNREDAKSTIAAERAKVEGEFNKILKDWEDFLNGIREGNITSQKDFENLFAQLAERAQTSSAAIQSALASSFTSLPGLIQANLSPTSATAGLFGMGLQTLVEEARTRFGIGTQNPASILGLTQSLLTGMTGEVSKAFDPTIKDNILSKYKAGTDAISDYTATKSDPDNPDSLRSLFKKAVKDANEDIKAEFIKNKTGAGSEAAKYAKYISKKFKDEFTISETVASAIKAAQDAITNATGGSSGGSGKGSGGGSGGGGGGGHATARAYGGPIPYASGGPTFGPMHQGIPAILHGGEYVIRKKSVDKYGTQMLQNINQGIYNKSNKYFNGGMVGYAKGGIVDESTGKIGLKNISTKKKKKDWLDRIQDPIHSVMDNLAYLIDDSTYGFLTRVQKATFNPLVKLLRIPGSQKLETATPAESAATAVEVFLTLFGEKIFEPIITRLASIGLKRVVGKEIAKETMIGAAKVAGKEAVYADVKRATNEAIGRAIIESSLKDLPVKSTLAGISEFEIPASVAVDGKDVFGNIYKIFDEIIGFGLDPKYGWKFNGKIKNISPNPFDITGLSPYTKEGQEAAYNYASAYIGYGKKFPASDEAGSSMVDALLYASHNGDKKATIEFKKLAELGKAVKKNRIKKLYEGIDRITAKQLMKKANVGNWGIDELYLVHETAHPIKLDNFGNASINPTSDYVTDFNGQKYWRDTVHFALNHVVQGFSAGAMGGRESVEGGYVIVSKLTDVLKANPGSLGNLYGVDTWLTPPPGKGIVFPKGTFDIITENATTSGTVGFKSKKAQLLELLMKKINPSKLNGRLPTFVGGVHGLGGADEAGVTALIQQIAEQLGVTSRPHFESGPFNLSPIEGSEYQIPGTASYLFDKLSKNDLLRFFERKRSINPLIRRYSNRGLHIFNGGSVPYENGGPTFGPMHQGISAVLHGGEFVLRKKAVDKYGLDMLSKMNQGIYAPKIPKINIPFSNYSKIANSASPMMIQKTESNHNYNFYVDNFIGETEWFNQMMKEYNVRVVPTNQKQAGLENRVITTYNGINKGL